MSHVKMIPYGMRRNWNAVEDVGKNGHAESSRSHTATKKIYHRIARRWKNCRKNGKPNRGGVDNRFAQDMEE